MYWYASHLGGLFCSERKYSFKDLYCEECGDCDTFIGEFDTEAEAEAAYEKEFE